MKMMITYYYYIILLICLSSSDGCIPSQSQSGEEDAVIKHFFHDMKGGTYVEIGGFDGYRFSNTLRLHTCFGWNGVLVEASKGNYLSLIKNVKRYRPTVTHHFGAVCAPPKTSITLLDRGPMSGNTDTMAKSFKKVWHDGRKKSVRVDGVLCKPMSSYIEGLSAVNFFSLDVEGAELEVIQTIDLHKVPVDVFMIELDEHDPERNYKVRQVLFNLNYVECLNVVSRSALFVNTNATTKNYKCPFDSTTVPSPAEAATIARDPNPE